MKPAADGRDTVALLHWGFVVAGMATTLLGPLLPALAARWAMSDAAAGALFTAQFLSSTTLTIASGAVTARLGSGRTLGAGFLLIAIGVGVLGVAPQPLGVAATVLYGAGLGLVLPVTNFVVAALRPHRAASALSLVNVSWGVGAVIWPVLVQALSRAAGLAAATTLLALAAAATGLTVWRLADRRAGLARLGEADRAQPAAEMPGGPAPYGRVGLVGTVIFLYVGTETAVGGWAAELARRMAEAPAGAASGAWGYAPTAFWAAQTSGRLLAAVALRAVGERLVLSASLMLAGLAVAVLAWSTTSLEGAVAGAAAAGLGLAPVFPVVLAGAARDIAPRLPAAMGPIFAAGGIGGAMVPWVVGFVSSRAGSLQWGLLVPLGSIAAMLALTSLGRREA